MNQSLVTLLSCFALLPTAVAADRTLDKILSDRYHDKVLVLRQPLQSDYQQYDSEGKPLMVAPAGPWTIYQGVVVKKIELDGDQLRFECKRVIYVFKQDRLVPFQSNEDVRITVRLKNPSPSVDEAGRLLNSIFMFDEEAIVNAAPSYWRPYLRHPEPNRFAKTEPRGDDPPQSQAKESSATSSDADRFDGGVKVHRLGEPGVTNPKCPFRPDPECSEYARKLHLKGVVGINATIDSSGQVKDMVIIKPMGAGLDEQAVNTISTWRCDPAKKDGQPVAVVIYIETDFHSSD